MQRATSAANLKRTHTQSQLVGVTLVADTPVKRQRTWDAGDFAASGSACAAAGSSVEVVVIENTPERSGAWTKSRDGLGDRERPVVDGDGDIEAVVIEDTPDRLARVKTTGRAQTSTHHREHVSAHSHSLPQPETKTQSHIPDFLFKTPTRKAKAGDAARQASQRPRGGLTAAGSRNASGSGAAGKSKSYISLLDEEDEGEEDDGEEEGDTTITPRAHPVFISRAKLPPPSSHSTHTRDVTAHAQSFDAGYDELADESFTDSFGSPDVLLLESSPPFPSGGSASMAQSTPSFRRKPATARRG